MSLADKAKKEELATVERILKVLTEDNRDVRKGTWSNKEVSRVPITHYRMINAYTADKPSSSRSGSRRNTPNEKMFFSEPTILVLMDIANNRSKSSTV